jgi:lysophospholipase L1-like esterase
VLLTTAIYIVIQRTFNNSFPLVPFPWVPRRSIAIYSVALILLLTLAYLIEKKRRFIVSKPDSLDIGLVLLALIGSILYSGFEGVLTISGLFIAILVLCISVRTIYLKNGDHKRAGRVVDVRGLVVACLGSFLILIAQDAEFYGVILGCQGAIFFIRDNFVGFGGKRNISRHLDVSAVSLILLCVTFVLVESALTYSADKIVISSGTAEGKSLTIPEEWKQRYLTLEGAEVAYYWHGELHVTNQDGMRTLGEYKIEQGARRYIFLGDSFTYGLGIGESQTYSAVLQRQLEVVFPTEKVATYNLGVPGANSGKVLDIAAIFLPKLKPHRVMYGVCLNDITEWYRELSTELAWSIPPIIGAPFSEKTKVGQLISVGYNQLLMQIGARRDFYRDILKRFDPTDDKFFRDVKAINQLSLQYSGNPVLVLVLNHAVGTNKPEHLSRKLSEIIEKQALSAGADVIPAKTFYDEYGDGHIPLRVSRWEGHPNENAHGIWAKMFFSYLSKEKAAKK